MTLLDPQGRLFGRYSLLDLSAGAVLGALALAAYLFLARPEALRQRLKGEPPLEAFRMEVAPERPALAALVGPGDVQRHAVTGKPVIECLSREGDNLRFRAWAKRGVDGVPMINDVALKAGGKFRFETPRAILLGWILSVGPEPVPHGPPGG